MAPTKSTRPASPERPAALGAKVKTAKGLGPKVKAAVKGLGPVKGAGVVKRSRQHRSGLTTGRIASLPPGPPPPPRWYQETDRSTIPVAIQHRLIASCHVDFLDNGLGGTNNCAMRLIFTNPQTHATKHAPAGTRGIIIRFMRSDGGAGPAGGLVPFGGMLRYQPIGYITPHPQAAHNFAVPVVPGMRVRDFMRVVNANNMLPAEFSSLAADTVGCRDFTSQWLLHCNTAGVVAIPAPAAAFWNNFNFVYRHPAAAAKGAAPVPIAPVASVVGFATFKDLAHVHAPIAGINYATAAAMAASLAAQNALRAAVGLPAIVLPAPKVPAAKAAGGGGA